MICYTYILECSDGSLYTGWTNNLYARIDAHNRGEGAKYTRSRLPVRLLYRESYSNKSEAMKREAEIKNMSRKEKLELIESAHLVEINPDMCSTCRYGLRESICGYLLITKKRRDCPIGLCNKHTPATKEEKREIQRSLLDPYKKILNDY